MGLARDNRCSEPIDRAIGVAVVVVTARATGAVRGRFLSSPEGSSVPGTPTTKVASNLG
jgi:hypothetical protein